MCLYNMYLCILRYRRKMYNTFLSGAKNIGIDFILMKLFILGFQKIRFYSKNVIT